MSTWARQCETRSGDPPAGRAGEAVARLLNPAFMLPDPTGADGDRKREGWQSTSRVAPSALTRRADRAIQPNNEPAEPERTAYFGGGRRRAIDD